MSWADRALIAALVRRLPKIRWPGLLVTRATILRWHPPLISRHWTTNHHLPGRPPLPSGLRGRVARLATETRPGATECTANWPAEAGPPEVLGAGVPAVLVVVHGVAHVADYVDLTAADRHPDAELLGRPGNIACQSRRPSGRAR